MAEADSFPPRDRQVAAGPAGALSTPAEPARSSWTRRAVMFVVPLLIVLGGLWWWFGDSGVVSTDNAYVKDDIVSIAGELQGLVVSVNVHENQPVRAGDVLFTINPVPYQVAIAQANAQIAAAQANVTSLGADVGSNAALLQGARDDLRLAEADYQRGKALMDRGFNTRAAMDANAHAVAAARDHLVAVEAQVASARAKLATGSAVPGVNPAIAAAEAARAKAAFDLQRTVVRAPADGTISQASKLQVGQMVFPGVPMISLVRAGSARIDANFKETDLAYMKVGQPATIKLDAYPGHTFRGHVESIGAGTGSEFSILPAQNATGNWVKIVQRVPVRIAIDGTPERPMIAGLSAVVSVDVGKH